jgi:poly-gamma-glutamate synthesis protein (capsule biosynthesis protein)
MNQRGILYPGQDIRDTLREADILHISNEVPYAPDCPLPNPNQADLRFCSDPAYNALLEDVGADVIELTGDHFGDYGAGAMRDTLDLYREKGWVYYGGGYDRDDARQARLIEHHGNKIAFIGCNAKGDGYATASDATPGAVACDFDWMHGEIARLRAEGYLVIATFQHFEYYTYAAQPNQIADSRGMAEAGAVIVSGSQAHQPQAMEFYKGAFIHYGLGNLFFDQYYLGLPTSQGFLDRHVFYDGRYIGVEPLGILFIDFARPRPMTRQERMVLLRSVFEASGW